ncbi:MAG: hypothetical protein IJ225_03185 [Solobacterium sp.]|nr:hypothetical protein [Solobacterium sp.]
MAELTGDYRSTNTYKTASKEVRKRIEDYRSANDLKANHMYLLLLREDYRRLPKEEKQKGNRPAELMVFSGILVFLVMTASDNRQLLPFAGIYMIIATAVYFSGILNPYSRQLSNINKLLKKQFPEVPAIKEVIDGPMDKE